MKSLTSKQNTANPDKPFKLTKHASENAHSKHKIMRLDSREMDLS